MKPSPNRPIRAIAAPTGALALLVLAGCGPKLDELRAEPIRFEVRTSVPFETMANCLVARSMDDYIPTPQIYKDKGLAYVTLNARMGSGIAGTPIQGEYTVRGIDGGSVVDYRRRRLIADLGGGEQRAREAVEACSKG